MSAQPQAQTAIRVRDSVAEDLDAIRAIYAHHVLKGLGSFEEIPPDAEEIGRRRMRCLSAGMPHVVAEVDGVVRGFAYAAPFRDRSAYRHTVEDSVYVDAAVHGQGIGRALLQVVIARSAAAGFHQMVAVIGDSGNRASIILHERAGFRRAGVLRSVGHKFGRWVDSVLMQRPLQGSDLDP